MRRTPILLLTCGVVGVVASVQAAVQDRGLHLRHLASPAPGMVQALIETDSQVVPAPASSGDFALVLPSGPARDLSVSRNGDRGGVTTLVVLDESGSYRSRSGGALARRVLREYVHELDFPHGDRIGLVAFGADATTYPLRQAEADFIADLDDPRRRVQQSTNVLAGLDAARAGLRKELDERRALPGRAELIVFTDAGDQVGAADARWNEIAEEATVRATRISAVVSSPTGGSGSLLKSVLGLRGLAQRTYGLYETSADPTKVLSSLRAARAAAQGWLVLEGRLCGVPQASGAIAARVDYAPGGARQGWSESRQFAPEWAPGSEGACVAAQQTCSPACSAWEDCVGGRCTARQCAAHETCGATARCVTGLCQPLAPRSLLRRWPIWVVGGLGLLLLIVATWLLRRRPAAAPEQEAPEVLDEPAAPEAPAAPAPEAESPAPPLTPLPETHLVAVGGSVTPGEKWRLYKQKTYVGGSRDPQDGNDIVFSVSRVSGRHALFELYPSGDLWITDLEARNGTFVNGQQLKPGERTKLRVGDQIKLSQQLILQVVRPGFEAAARPVDIAADAAAPSGSPPGKKRTFFDPGNR